MTASGCYRLQPHTAQIEGLNSSRHGRFFRKHLHQSLDVFRDVLCSLELGAVRKMRQNSMDRDCYLFRYPSIAIALGRCPEGDEVRKDLDAAEQEQVAAVEFHVGEDGVECGQEMEVVDGDVWVHGEEPADFEDDAEPDFLACGQRVAALHGGRDDGRHGAAQKSGDDLYQAGRVQRDRRSVRRHVFRVQPFQLGCDTQHIRIVHLVVGHEVVAQYGRETHGHEGEPGVPVEAFHVRRVGEQRAERLGVVQQGGREYAGRQHELVAHVGDEGDERLAGDEMDCLLGDEPDDADGVGEAGGGWDAQRPRCMARTHPGRWSCRGGRRVSRGRRRGRDSGRGRATGRRRALRPPPGTRAGFARWRRWAGAGRVHGPCPLRCPRRRARARRGGR